MRTFLDIQTLYCAVNRTQIVLYILTVNSSCRFFSSELSSSCKTEFALKGLKFLMHNYINYVLLQIIYFNYDFIFLILLLSLNNVLGLHLIWSDTGYPANAGYSFGRIPDIR